MKSNLFVIFLFLLSLGCAACLGTQQKESIAAPAPVVSPSPMPTPPTLISFLREGGLWVIRQDGGGERQLVPAPPGASINDHVWSKDGNRVYYNVGLKYFSCSIYDLKENKIQEAGELTAPANTTIDRLELDRDGTHLIAQALPENADLSTPPMLYATTLVNHTNPGSSDSRADEKPPAPPETRQLSVDEYHSLARPQSVVVREFQDFSVSPDSQFLLFKEVVGDYEQLFIADMETGARMQITNLSELGGFEPAIESLGDRRIIEAVWSADGRFVIFNPAQSCSDLGLCYGQLFLVDVWSGVQLQLTREMTVNVAAEWKQNGTLVAYDDGGQIVVADKEGRINRLTEGNRPKIQPDSATN